MSDHLDVMKTYKLFINGAFPRSESGRVFEVRSPKGRFIANPSLASRKDLRDAVVSARSAHPGWAKSTAYLRGQILYRIAEMLDGRKEQFISELQLSHGLTKLKSTSEVDYAIDRWVWYAGWSDKLSASFGALNPVAGPYYNFTIPEPQGVIAIAAPHTFSGFVEALGAAVVSGNTVVVLVDGASSIAAMSFAEVLATSDLPAGVINILTGSHTELAPWAASHMDIDGFDITGIEMKARSALKESGAENLKRIHTFDGESTVQRIFAFMEAKTVWHTIGY